MNAPKATEACTFGPVEPCGQNTFATETCTLDCPAGKNQEDGVSR
eukprot:CAMPEP_0172894014 /NCGR_PEP_ID=MMETSP1075-20121228/149940_1 /TAXON_ID=2916 /ORGANISM="Ceratium fusus, Strain PA161109" /LENGTH=44 /DNA_ID= /DNA_START= /DNA_END= /DNA_ORIENTATION=